MSEGYVGEIRIFAGTFAPRGWALCDGQLLAISKNDALFSLLGTIYGGDGRTTFALPDLRGRAAVHPGNPPRGRDEDATPKKSDSKNPTSRFSIADTDLNEDGEITLSEFFKAFESLDVNKDGRISDKDFNSEDTNSGSKQTTNDSPEKRGIRLGANGPILETDGEAKGPGTLAMNFIICLYGTYPSRS